MTLATTQSGAVICQSREKHFHSIFYACKTIYYAQENYTTTEKDLFAVVLQFDNFRSYLVLSKTTMFIDHSALPFLFQIKYAKPRLQQRIIVRKIAVDKKGSGNVAVDHLSHLNDPKREEIHEEDIGDTFPHGPLILLIS